MGSKKLAREGCTRVQYPIWLHGRVHISVNICPSQSGCIMSSPFCNRRYHLVILNYLTCLNVGYFINGCFSPTADDDGP